MARPDHDHGDVALALLTAVAALVALTVGPMSDPSAVPRGADAAGIVLTIAATVPIAWRRRRPRASVAVAGAAALVLSLGGWGLTVGALAVWLLVGSAALHTDRRTSLGLCAISSVAACASVFAFSTDNRDVLDLALALGVGALPALVGDALRRQRELTEEVHRLRDAELRAAVDAERLRIARDVHDTVGHHLSAIGLQARAGRLERPDGALAAIERLSDRALGDTRRTLGLLRGADAPELAPQPTIADLSGLVDTAALAGVTVTLETEGRRDDLPDLVSTCAFRVLQEALTNTARHAGPGRAHLTIRRADGRLVLTVVDDGEATGGPAGEGHGLIGMRERVRALGGILEAAPHGGGWRVHAELPDAL